MIIADPRDAEFIRLRASHDRLLTAAVEVVAQASRDVPRLRTIVAISALKAAIAKAEESAS